MDIKNIIVHKLNKEVKEKDKAQSPITIDFRPSELDKNNKLVKQLIERIAESFKRGKTFGSFNTDKANHPFQTWLGNMYDNNETFIDLTQKTMNRFKSYITKENFATGGHIIFCSYKISNKTWFMVVMLKEKDGFSFENLNLKNIQELDIDKLHQLARVDVTTWKDTASDSDAYLSFINKKSGDAAGYFVNALGCTDIVPSKLATKSVFNIIDQIFEQATLTFEEAKSTKELVYDFLDKRRPNAVKLEEIAAIINAHLPIDYHDHFIDLANSDTYQVSDEFEPNLSVLKSFKRIKHTTKNWSLDIDRSAIGRPNSGSNIVYDEKNKTLTFLEIPSSLAVDIMDNLPPVVAIAAPTTNENE